MSNGSSERDHLIEALLQTWGELTGLSVLISQAIADRAGLHSTDLEALDLLRLRGAMPAGKLAEITGLTTGAITGLIDRLERRGYVSRQPDSADRRRVIVVVNSERVERELLPYYLDMFQTMTRLGESLSTTELMTMVSVNRQGITTAGEVLSRMRAKEQIPGSGDNDA